jgi:hypothetical protein
MTKRPTVRCAWCGERFAISAGPGRRPRYCRRSHRQRAYESRRIAAERGLAKDEVLLTMDNWRQARDALYIAEAAARDAENDLADDPTTSELLEIIRGLVQAIDAAAAVHAEPKAIGELE